MIKILHITHNIIQHHTTVLILLQNVGCCRCCRCCRLTKHGGSVWFGCLTSTASIIHKAKWTKNISKHPSFGILWPDTNWMNHPRLRSSLVYAPKHLSSPDHSRFQNGTNMKAYPYQPSLCHRARPPSLWQRPSFSLQAPGIAEKQGKWNQNEPKQQPPATTNPRKASKGQWVNSWSLQHCLMPPAQQNKPGALPLLCLCYLCCPPKISERKHDCECK